MANLAVLKYQFVIEKPVGIPNEWPAQTINLGILTELPGLNWVLMTEAEYQTHIVTYQGAYDAWAASYYAPIAADVAMKKIQASQNFGEALMTQFASENVVMGITQAGKTIPVSDYLAKLQNYVLTGSLYAAITEIDNKINDPLLELLYSPYLTVARLTLYKQKIQAFLGSL